MKIGCKIIRLTSVDSTNNYVANLIEKGEIKSGTVIMADDQNEGKGQRGAEWHVKPGENLTFSVYYSDVNLSVDRVFVLTQLVSVAIVDLLKKFGIVSSIKWPNDIYVGQQKIAGVLIENQIAGTLISNTIIGVGLNINQQEFKNFEATSLFLSSGVSRKPVDVLYSFIESFNLLSQEFNGNELIELRKLYMSHLYQLNVSAKYRDKEGDFEGVIKDVLDKGELLSNKGYEMQTYTLKEIQFIS